MVCERLPDSPNDPAEGRIALVRDGDWLTADGTTLGADNGIGIAAMMALAEDASLPHGPLELLMTVNEEIGGPGEGASGLDPSARDRGDAVEPGQRGGREADRWLCEQHRHVDPGREAAGGVRRRARSTLSVSVSGGLGGHSGTDIARGRANAIKVLGRVLREALAARAVPARSPSQGGRSWNAIPRDATAICSVSARARGRLPCCGRGVGGGGQRRLRSTDPGVTVTIAARGRSGRRLDGRGDPRHARPHRGRPERAARDEPGLRGTRRDEHLARRGASPTRRTLTLHSLSRSSNASALPAVLAALEAAARLAGGSLEIGQADPGWRPNLDSARPRHFPSRLTSGSSAKPRPITAVHAWLETAVIGDRVPGLDMLSFGPQIEAPHSPDERVSIPTVERFWRLLVRRRRRVLSRLKARIRSERRQRLRVGNGRRAPGRDGGCGS